jgi:fibronectin-binding autotransporter adhesin
MKLKYIYHVSSLRAVSTVVAFLAVSAFSAQAAPQTWSAANGNWNTTDTNFTGAAWTNGNSAIFGGTAVSTVTINIAGISAAGVTFNVDNDIIAGTSTNNLTLAGGNIITVGSGLKATINAPLAGSGGVQVENTGTGPSILNLGGASTVTGGGSGALGLIVGATTASNTVNLSIGGTMGTSGTNRRSLFIGSSGAEAGLTTTGSNIVNLSTAGSSGSPTFNVSGNGTRATIGYASSNNELNVSNGAYVAQTNGGGTNTWNMGVLAGADGNKITVAGANSSIVFGSNQSLNVGVAGSNNSTTISAGGKIGSRRFGIGTNGGDNNSLVVTGTNSIATTDGVGASNALFEMGSTAGSNFNSMSIAAGGKYVFVGSGSTQRYFAIGRLGDDNYMEIKGTNSLLDVNFNEPVTIGGTSTGTAGATLTEGGARNHLDINTGGAATLTGTSLYVMGTDSAVNLGNGTGVGTLTVGATSGATNAGVWLKDSSGRLNFNSGKLIAGAAGNLVSGHADSRIDLKGDATVSTTFSSTISVVIEDSTSSGGDFIKEGSGTLDLTQVNTYKGDTIVNAGTLKIQSAYLANAAAVQLFSAGSGKLDLNHALTDTIGALYFDGVPQAAGTWGGTGSGADNINTTYFAANSGKLLVVAIPEPGAALLSAVGLLALLRRRRA